MSTSHCSFYRHRDLLDLHSFPTRRSSDLQFDVVSIKPNVGGALPAGPPNFRPDGGFTMIRVPISVLIGRAYPGNRSEEHTSELQSLRHIVCRLLLEKKNSI